MSKIPTTPKELIAALQSAGEIDNAHWEQFDALYRPVIRLFLEQKFGSLVAADAEDLAQDVMVKLIEAFKKGLYEKTSGNRTSPRQNRRGRPPAAQAHPDDAPGPRPRITRRLAH